MVGAQIRSSRRNATANQERLGGCALALLACILIAWSAAPAQASNGIRHRGLTALDGLEVLVNETHILVYGNGTAAFEPRAILGYQNVSFNSTEHIGLYGVTLSSALPEDWRRFEALHNFVLDCAGPGPASVGGAAGAANNSTGIPRFGSETELQNLKEFIQFKEGVSVRSISILNCGMQGDYGAVWQEYLSGVQMVNLSGNALTGDFTTIDHFDSVCTDDFAGDDYNDPDCNSPTLYVLDVSRNALSGHLSTDAVLGDDITDAVCSTGCISLVFAPGVTQPEALCMAPLLVYALDNPGLVYRHGTRFASGYVIGDHTNWCFEPASRWVLPVLWGVFLTVLFSTLAMTLYARVRLKRVPFRMSSSRSYDLLTRGADTQPIASSPRTGSGFVPLPGKGAAVELAERQAMIPKESVAGAHGDSNGQAMPLVAVGAVGPAELPVSVQSSDAHHHASCSSATRPPRKPRRGKADPEGIRVALTSDMSSSALQSADSEVFSEADLEPEPCGATLGLRAAAAAAGVPITDDGSTSSKDEGTWRAFFRAALSRALDIFWMELRTFILLGMFGLELYWAYGLILYRGGWQMLVLVPNYLEQTVAGTAMLRAFMAGTHGRWKYVAPIPLLPFTMAAVYLVWGFIAYPFGWADLGPISWEKFIDLMDSCGVLSSSCWAIFSSLAYWQGNSVSTSYQYFNTDIFLIMMFICFTDLLSTAHHLASTLQIPFKQWLRRELDVRRIKIEPDKSHRLGDGYI